MRKWTLAIAMAFAVTGLTLPAADGGIIDLLAEEQFVGYDWGEYLDDQQTSSTIGFDGTETWDAAAAPERGWRVVEQGLSYPGLASAGGAVEPYRTTTWKDGDARTARLIPETHTPHTNDDGWLYLSALINADGYEAREDDEAHHGVDVTLIYRTASPSRDFGFGFGGASGGDDEAARTVRLTTNDHSGSDAYQTDVVLEEGTNLLVLAISPRHELEDDTTHYKLWLNPDLFAPQGTPDYVHTEEYGLTGSASDGFLGFRLLQSFNGEQSGVFVDELRVGSDWAAVTIPEPASLALMGLGGLLLIRRRR